MIEKIFNYTSTTNENSGIKSPKNSSKKLEAENTNSKKPKLGLNIKVGNKNG